jgi:hypothetical protein
VPCCDWSTLLLLLWLARRVMLSRLLERLHKKWLLLSVLLVLLVVVTWASHLS